MSSQSDYYSDEHLNAFIDNQLGPHERAELLDLLRNDMTLSKRVCELQKVRSLVQLTYQSVELPENYSQHKTRRTSRFGWGIAASLLLGLGMLAGWFANQQLNPPSLMNFASQVQVNQPVAAEQNWNLMLHVSTADPYRLNILLDEAESLLQEYANSPQKLNLEILTNSKGLDLVSHNGKSHSARLREMQKKFSNLSILACGMALKRLKQKTGKELMLTPGTSVVPSAMQQIIKRQKQGWTYIHI